MVRWMNYSLDMDWETGRLGDLETGGLGDLETGGLGEWLIWKIRKNGVYLR